MTSTAGGSNSLDSAEVASDVDPSATKASTEAFVGSDMEAVQKRLSRIEGQIRGIKRMIDEGRSCKEVVTQFAAVSRALEQAAFGLVASQLTYCIEFPEEAKRAGYSVEEVKRLLTRLR